MKAIIIFLWTFLSYNTLWAQLSDSQLKNFNAQKSTQEKINLLSEYFPARVESAKTNIISLRNVLRQFDNLKKREDIPIFNLVIGTQYFTLLQDYPNSLKYEIESLKDFKLFKDSIGILHATFITAAIFQYSKNYDQSILYFKEVLPMAKAISYNFFYPDLLNGIADCYIRLKKPDSSLAYLEPAIKICIGKKDTFNLMYYIGTLGEAYLAKKQYDVAKKYLSQSLHYAHKFSDSLVLSNISLAMSQLLFETGQYDSSIHYARQCTNYANNQSSLSDGYYSIYKSYEKENRSDSALKYLKLSVHIQDSAFSIEKNSAVHSLNFQKQLWDKEKEQELIATRKDFNSRLNLYMSFGVLFIVLAIAILFYRNINQQKKSKAAIQWAYDELKSTQSQLIQSEKMASLGELTAGIAHEIQNPLNFVNNFSDVNKELLQEMNEEIDKGNLAEVKSISRDIIDNEEKINQHGKRADAIVKGMLQHSRTSNGVKELTNINRLTDEYLRMAYHGLRAKDKSFNATLDTSYDESMSNVNIIPQDIGRVLLNLVNNAFYAVAEKKKQSSGSYEPAVSLSTKCNNGKVEIRVADNGNGIPQRILDKIFQPFFTTKPTGQGTGLGLSLSYDIIKAHGGQLTVETKEGEGSIFIIQLPQNKDLN